MVSQMQTIVGQSWQQSIATSLSASVLRKRIGPQLYLPYPSIRHEPRHARSSEARESRVVSGAAPTCVKTMV